MIELISLSRFLILRTTTLLPHPSRLKWSPGDNGVELMVSFLHSQTPEQVISQSLVAIGFGYSLDTEALHENLSLSEGQVLRGDPFPNSLNGYSCPTFGDEKIHCIPKWSILSSNSSVKKPS